VARTVNPGATSSMSPTNGAAASTCSKLSATEQGTIRSLINADSMAHVVISVR
jgi:hypothetical protein